MHKIQSISLLLWLVLAAVTLAAYDDGTLNYPLKELCRRWDHQSIVLDNKLYLAGGRVLIKETLQKKLGNKSLTWEGEPSSEFIVLNLQESFSLEKLDDNGDGLPKWAPVKYTLGRSLDGVEEPLAVANGGMWTRDNKLYLYEGQRTKGAKANDLSTLLSFDVAASQWSLEKGWDNVDGSLPNRFARGTSVNVPEIGMGFYVGGARMYLGENNTKEWKYPIEQQFVGMDVGNQNYEVKYQKIMEGARKTMGAAVTWIPVGEKGSLIMFGGTNEVDQRAASPVNGYYVDDIKPDNSTLASEREVYIYDIANDKWHMQISNGDHPQARMDACAVGATAPDGKSHQIYYYGGSFGTRMFGMDDSKFKGDLYVLNIPTFNWKRFTDLKNPPAARTRHTCHVINNRQMMIIGGSRNDSYTEQAQWCRWDEISVLDMTDLRWETTYTPATEPYSVNPTVYANTLKGGVAVNEPELGWTSKAVQELFTANSTDSSKGTEESGLSKGALIGIIVGAAAVVVLAIAGFFLWKRRKAARLERERDSDDSREPYRSSSTPGSPYDKKQGGFSPGFPGGGFEDTSKNTRPSELSANPVAVSEMAAESRPLAEMPAESVIYELPTTERSPTQADFHGGYLSDTSQSPNPLSRTVSDLSQAERTKAGTQFREMSPVSPATILEEITSVSSGTETSSSFAPQHDGVHYPTRSTPLA